MYYLYPDEYFFPVIMKNREEIDLEDKLADSLTRGSEDYNYSSAFDEFDAEYASSVTRNSFLNF